jgi:FAD synthetase
MRTILVFGTFDGIHAGHRAFFVEAHKYGDRLIVAVAQDAVVEELKGRPPKRSLAERIAALEKEPLVDEAVAGDEVLGSWEVVKKHRPDVIALGYDQDDLHKALTRAFPVSDPIPEVVIAHPHRPEEMHNEFLKKNGV